MSNKKTYPVVIDTWTESERGWGQRFDGYSLHLSKDSYKKYVDAYWKTMPASTPDEYSRPDNRLDVFEASGNTYFMLKDLEKVGVFGMQIFDTEGY